MPVPWLSLYFGFACKLFEVPCITNGNFFNNIGMVESINPGQQDLLTFAAQSFEIMPFLMQKIALQERCYCGACHCLYFKKFKKSQGLYCSPVTLQCVKTLRMLHTWFSHKSLSSSLMLTSHSLVHTSELYQYSPGSQLLK